MTQASNWERRYETVMRTVVVPSPTLNDPHVAAYSPSFSSQSV
jgi:hypothetical protein